MHNLHPGANLQHGANLHLGANLHPLAYANKSWSNSLCLNILGDSDPLSLRVMCVRDISIAWCGVETFTFHSYKSQKSIIVI